MFAFLIALLEKDWRILKRNKTFSILEIGFPILLIGLAAFFEKMGQNKVKLEEDMRGLSSKLGPQTIEPVNLLANLNQTQCRDTDEKTFFVGCDRLEIDEYYGKDKEIAELLLNKSAESNITIHGGIVYKVYNKKKFSYVYLFPEGSMVNVARNSDEFAAHQHQTNINYMNDVLNITFPIDTYNLGVLPNMESSQTVERGYHEFESVLISLAMMTMIICTTKNIVGEKTTVKAYLMAMGLPIRAFYSAHFLFSLLKSSGMVLMILLFSKTAGNADTQYIFFSFLVLYVLCSVSFALFISSVFQTTKRAIEGGLIIWLLSLIAPSVHMNFMPKHSSAMVLICSLNPNHALQYFFRVVDNPTSKTAMNYGGHDWKTFTGLLVIDTVLMLLLTVVIDWSRKIVSESNWAQFFKMIFCCNRINSADIDDQEQLIPQNAVLLADGAETDAARDSATADIEVRSLVKVYSTGERAVDKLSLRAIRGQVSVLLGHNGCGKSTLFSLISGIILPTSGSIKIEEIDAVKDRSLARDVIGLCPQFNPLFDKLTVMEHLELVHTLKGANREEFDDEADQLLKAIDLTDKANVIAKNLSGGMKRKLCVCMALNGDSRVVLLDEPTAGMDPGARQDVQRLLERIKSERTILLTTHYMDEAERLGDWIFVMARGKMATSGSSGFLKKKFGSGYLLTVIIENSPVAGKNEENHKLVESLCKFFVENSVVKDTRGQMIEITLPEEEKPQILKLLKALEAVVSDDLASPDLVDLSDEQRESLAPLTIITIGLSLNSLEQVFIKIGEECDAILENYDGSGTGGKKKKEENYKELIEAKEEPLLSGLERYFSQLIGLFSKRLAYSLRHKSQYMAQVLIPILLILVFCVQSKRDSLMKMSISESYDLDSYEPSIALIASESDTSNITKYLSQFKNLKLVEVSPHDIHDYILKQQNKTDSKKIAFAVFKSNETSLALFYNPQFENSKFIMTNLMSNLFLSSNGGAYIETGVEWVKEDEDEEQSRDPGANKYSSLPYLIFISIALCTSPMIVYLVEERACKFYHQQCLAGVSQFLFWMVNFVWDFIVYLTVVLLMTAIFVFSGFFKGHLLTFWLITFLYFFAILALIYLASSLVKSPTKAGIYFFIYQILFSLLVHHCKIYLNYESKTEKDVYHIIFCVLFLGSAFLESCKKVFTISTSLLKKEEFTMIHGFYDLYAWDGIVKELLSMLVVSLVAVCLIVAQNNRSIRLWIFNMTHKKQKRSEKRTLFLEENSCEAVGKERILIQNNETEECVVIISDLIRKYGNFRALKGISLTVRRNECFGMLGTNGAGKTTAFDILTGLTLPNGGYATIDGMDVSRISEIGYCPQFDAIQPHLTGMQALVIMSRIHGYQNPTKTARILLNCVGMMAHCKKKFKKLSGGQKRKLSVAIALLSRSKCVMLDEPTAGIDPRARRDIWEIMVWLRETGSSLVLTSHSMEECEALCSRIAVMKNGDVSALGTSQELKSQYGNYFTMTLVLHKFEDRETVCKAVLEHIPNATLMTASTNITLNLAWKLPKLESDKWSKTFEMVKNIAEELEVKDFMLIQSSLEDAFISLTGSKI